MVSSHSPTKSEFKSECQLRARKVPNSSPAWSHVGGPTHSSWDETHSVHHSARVPPHSTVAGDGHKMCEMTESRGKTLRSASSIGPCLRGAAAGESGRPDQMSPQMRTPAGAGQEVSDGSEDLHARPISPMAIVASTTVVGMRFSSVVNLVYSVTARSSRCAGIARKIATPARISINGPCIRRVLCVVGAQCGSLHLCAGAVLLHLLLPVQHFQPSCLSEATSCKPGANSV